MLYLALALKLSLTNLSAPIGCLFQLFHWPVNRKTEKIIPKDENENQQEIPVTAEDMRKLIETLKSGKNRI